MNLHWQYYINGLWAFTVYNYILFYYVTLDAIITYLTTYMHCTP